MNGIGEWVAIAVPSMWLKAGAGLLVLGWVTAVTYVVAIDATCPPRRYWANYIAHLERQLRNMFNQTKGTPIAVAQLASMLLVYAVWLAARVPYWYLAVAAIALGPVSYIEKLRRSRLKRLERQIEPLILTLANALKTTPSVGNALAVVHPLLTPPIQDEIGLVLKEVRLGSTLEQSLLNVSSRVRIMELEATLSSILIGRQVGGNLPQILENTSSTLREMMRLKGIVKSKTASGRTQIVVLALAPLAVLVAFDRVSPGFFEPLSHSVVGWIISTASGVLWVAALVLARKVLAVDI